MTLAADTATARTMGAPPRQYAATVMVPGYTRPIRRGRAQSAAWWPIAGDSIVVQFTQGQQSRGEVQLRGALHVGAISGEVWYVSNETGSSFQLGTFQGTKSR